MESVKEFYKKYQTILIPSFFLFISLFIFIQVILPSFSSIGSLQEQIGIEQSKLDDYKNSIIVLNSLDEDQIQQYGQIAASALPPSKDVESIYLAITKSAQDAGVTLSGFSVSPGDVFGSSGPVPVAAKGVPFVSVKVQVDGVNIGSLLMFSQSLLKSDPLNKITDVNISGGQGTIDIVFYYKPYDLNQLNKIGVQPLTSDQLQLLNDLPQP